MVHVPAEQGNLERLFPLVKSENRRQKGGEAVWTRGMSGGLFQITGDKKEGCARVLCNTSTVGRREQGQSDLCDWLLCVTPNLLR
jgi:hypothetical protein